MVTGSEILGALRERGARCFTGVPCSFLTPLINGVLNDKSLNYVMAAQEGEALAIASGAWLAGKPSVVMIQNSGLGNMVNALTSLNYPFRIPVLLIVTWRGQPGIKDEPQHELMGQIMHSLLSTMGIGSGAFPKEASEIPAALDKAYAFMERESLPYALILEQGMLAPESLNAGFEKKDSPRERVSLETHGTRPKRIEALKALVKFLPETVGIIATTGKCGRELFTVEDRKQQLYQVGSMGCASAMGLGVALNSKNKTVVLDGDGALLMKMGNMATIGAAQPKNLIHILLDNQTHDSTGGQATVSSQIEFSEIAKACGYQKSVVCDDMSAFEKTVLEATEKNGPYFIHLKIQPGSLKELGRPTLKPVEVARRFRSFLSSINSAI